MSSSVVNIHHLAKNGNVAALTAELQKNPTRIDEKNKVQNEYAMKYFFSK